MVDFSCSFVSVCKLRKPLGGASSKLRSPHAPPKNPLRWARLAVACRTSVAEGRLTSCSPSAKARWRRLSATACPQQALCPQRGQQPVPRGRRGGARGGEMAFATMNASPPRNCRMRKCSPRKGMRRMRNAPAGRRYTCRMRNAPAGRRYICRMQNAPLERKPATCEMPHLGRGFTSHKFHAKINKKITKE